jgi:hypothetical protein
VFSSHVGRDRNTGGRESNAGRCGVDPFDSRTVPRPIIGMLCDGVGTGERGQLAAQLAEDVKLAA